MGIYEWLSIALICVAGATTPGPSVLVKIYINNTRGFLSGNPVVSLPNKKQ